MRFPHVLATFVAALLAAHATADVSTFSAIKDATLIESAGGTLANGAEDNFWVGRTGQASGEDRRRGIIAFNISSIPTGSTVTAVTLTLFMDKTGVPARTVTAHRCLADWGEGTSVSTLGSGGGGAGGPATTNSATWIHRFYSGTNWSVAGGQMTAAASASTSVNAQGQNYTWSGAGMVADVQAWVNSPATNFGWILKGDEGNDGSAKRFVSRTGSPSGNRPVLSVTFTPPSGACCDVNGQCSVLTQAACTAAGGTYQGNGSDCSPNPCPPPTGACCFGNGTCDIVTEADCNTQGGLYQGNGTDCSPNPCGGAVTDVFVASQDNTIYETATTSNLSNGAGENIIVGTSSGGFPIINPARRGLISFDLTSIPSNAVVSSASLRMFMLSTADTLTRRVELYRARSTWGEAGSNAAGNETSGASAQTGDVTWHYRFYPTTTWGADGGDILTTLVAAQNVTTASNTAYTWSSGNLVSDVQGWISTPSTNRGWFITTVESAASTQRIFASRHNGLRGVRPSLSITYSVPQPTGACCIAADGTCSVITQLDCAANGGNYLGDNTSCSPNPCPQPTGACCLPTGFCATLTAADCAAQSGTYNGNASSCTGLDCPIILSPFQDALPIPVIATPTTGAPNSAAHYDIDIVQVGHQYHSSLPVSLSWGYEGFVPGPTILARKDQLVTVTWRNELRVPGPTAGYIRTHPLVVDTCVNGPDQTGTSPVTVVHLHGAKVAPESDGDPDAAFPPGQQSPLYSYPNGQPAATMWYHDHALGITRLNVYMGLAGFYLISDPAEDALVLPRNQLDVPLVIQDRSFHPNGALKYNTTFADHFFGDFITVNGKVWPYQNVVRGKYRYRLLNGSGSRAYTLALSNNATFHLISTDTGLMGAPVPLTSITILPGERADVVIDFAPYPVGTQIILTNSAVAPFPNGDVSTIIPDVMKFIVVASGGGNPVPHTAPLPATLVPVTPIPSSPATIQRNFVLRNFPDTVCGHPDGMWLINGLMWDDITERPRDLSTEIWAWVNRSSFTHPMHVHLVRFQVLDRQAFTVINNQEVPTGPILPPAPAETGWKDTVQAPPNFITRVIMKFEGFTGLFPYHCHILEHEDHEMMRRFQVVCIADTDDGTGTGSPDGGVGIEDLLFYLSLYDAGDVRADTDDGSSTGTPDGGVGIEDLLFFLSHYDLGC